MVGKFISVQGLRGSVLAIVIGSVTSLLAGFGVTNAAQQAFDKVASSSNNGYARLGKLWALRAHSA